MDPEDLIVTQMGLLLTQFKFVRRAMESIERSTSRYGTFSFAEAFQSSARFGAPPLFNGALKVYVTNINELAPGRGIGGFIEGLLGGVGRFLGGFGGGLVSSVIGGLYSIPIIILKFATITKQVNEILQRLGIGKGASLTEKVEAILRKHKIKLIETKPNKAGSKSKKEYSPDLGTILERWQPIMKSLTELFSAAGSGKKGATLSPASEKTASGWTATLKVINDILRGLPPIINGLIILLPILIGSLAMFIYRLNDIKLAIVEMLQFALRNVLLLRGVILVTIFDTVSSAAKLAANILGILATAVQKVLGAVFTVIDKLLSLALKGLKFITGGVKRVIDKLVPWLLKTVGYILDTLGRTEIFRFFHYFVRILPKILSPLILLIRNKSLSAPEIKSLDKAANMKMLTLSGAGAAGTATLKPFPNLGKALDPKGSLGKLSGEVAKTGATLTTETNKVFLTMQGALRKAGRSLDEGNFNRDLDKHRIQVKGHATKLAEALNQAQVKAQAAAAGSKTPKGLELIALAYQAWLTGGGLRALLDRINAHFQATPSKGAAARRSIPGRIVTEAPKDRTRATVEINKVIIEIAPPAESEEEAGDYIDALDEIEIGALLAEYLHNRAERGEEYINLEEQGMLV